ncbi:hypothetical protein JXI42_09185 [bacterium]|nr:hypothetical protein [bacterium]
MNINIEITGNLLEYLDQKVKDGYFKNRGDVVREAVRMMIREDLETEFNNKGLNPEEFEKLIHRIKKTNQESSPKDMNKLKKQLIKMAEDDEIKDEVREMNREFKTAAVNQQEEKKGRDIKEIFIEFVKNTPDNIINELFQYYLFLIHKEGEGFSTLSEAKFREIWDNDEDEVYDKFLQ